MAWRKPQKEVEIEARTIVNGNFWKEGDSLRNMKDVNKG